VKGKQLRKKQKKGRRALFVTLYVKAAAFYNENHIQGGWRKLRDNVINYSPVCKLISFRGFEHMVASFQPSWLQTWLPV